MDPHVENRRRNGVSCTNCSVVGCHNNYANTNKDIKFYAFPGKPHEKHLRELWIKAVRRNELSNKGCAKLWQPKKLSTICSAHFIGNRKSNHPDSPSYIPSIFPKEYGKSTPSEVLKRKKMERFERTMKRKLQSTRDRDNEITIADPSCSHEHNPIEKEEKSVSDFSCQVDMEDDQPECFQFECIFMTEKSEIATQAKIKIPQGKTYFKQYANKKVGFNSSVNAWECDGFHGFKTVKTSEELNNLSGVCFDRFDLLKSLLEENHPNDKLIMQDKLLLFLMKIQLGLSYCALAVIFGCHSTTVFKIFLRLLSELAQKTRNFVYWPSRRIIDSTLPRAFKVNYPSCRAIIDCSEIKIEQPNTVDKRIYMYSSYKAGHTVKFLIGIAPSGCITFISKGNGGKCSDTFITNDCGILDLLESGDVILADKGFPGIVCK